MQKSLPLLFLCEAILILFIPMGTAAQDSLSLRVKYAQTEDMQDLLALENINYKKYFLEGIPVKDKYVILTRQTFWQGEANAPDTIMDTRIFGLKTEGTEFPVRVMAKRSDPDTMRIQFRFPWFITHTDQEVLSRDDYTLADMIQDQELKLPGDPGSIILMVLSLPYEDPDRPGYKFYCELSKDGVPPEQWFETFGVPHYVIFRMALAE